MTAGGASHLSGLICLLVKRGNGHALVLKRHPDGLAAAQAVRVAGLCLFCEEPVRSRARPNTRHWHTCGGEECEEARWRARDRDKYFKRQSKRRTEAP